MATVRGGSVMLHAKAFADACAAATGAESFGTYPGHSPTIDRALDIFTSVPTDRRAPGSPGLRRVLGDDIADFARANMTRFGIWYIIWRQHILNFEIAPYWRLMGNRGDVTQNHFDHNHISFYTRASGILVPEPTLQGGHDMLIVNVKDEGIFLLRGDKTQHLTHPDHVIEWVKAGATYQDKVVMSKTVFQQYGMDRSTTMARATIAGEVLPPDEMFSAVQDRLAQVHEEYLHEMGIN